MTLDQKQVQINLTTERAPDVGWYRQILVRSGNFVLDWNLSRREVEIHGTE